MDPYTARRTGDAEVCVTLLGTAQDGGIPQIGCQCANCERARVDGGYVRLPACMLVRDSRNGKRFLIDATPALPGQLERAGMPQGGGNRPPLFDAIFLTHAHMGHYTGLLYLGREMYAAAGQPVYASARVCAFLRENEPWASLERIGHVEYRGLEPERTVALTEDASLTPHPVPHRDEFSDTFAFEIHGPHASLIYVPDTDAWTLWQTPIEAFIKRARHAVLDGTFFSDSEVRGRNVSDIPHPRIAESLDRFQLLPRHEREKICFTHMNHTNPAANEGSPEWTAIAAAAMRVAAEMQTFTL